MEGSGCIQESLVYRQDTAGEGEEGAGSLAHSFIPGLLPGDTELPPRGSCSEEEFSWRRPRNSSTVMGGTRLSCPRTSHLTPFTSLSKYPPLREATLITPPQRAPLMPSPFPSFRLLCVSCSPPAGYTFVCCFAVWLSHAIISPMRRRTLPSFFTAKSPAPRSSLA